MPSDAGPMHDARPRSLVSLCRCLRSGPIGSVERSARPCPRPSAGARVILRWRHAPLHSLSYPATPSRKVCRRRVRRGALAPDHAQLTAATSVKVQSCLPPRPCQAVNGDPCASDCLSVARRDACIARNSMGQASRSLCPATMALPGLDLDMGKVTVEAKLGSRRVLPRGVALLGGVLGHGRHRQPPSPCPLLAPWRPSLRPPIGRAPLGGALRR